MPYDLGNKVVLITGAATGIGSYVVRYLLEENIKHVAILDLAEDAGVALENELNSKHGANKVKFYKGDVIKDDILFSVFQSVIDQFGYIDVVINNAGILNDSWQFYKKQIEINVTAVVTSTLKALELMRKDQGGRGGLVINISSTAALMQNSVTAIYNATKSAVLQFTNCIGKEDLYSRTGVRMIAICYAPTKTPLLSEEKVDSYDQVFKSEMLNVLRTLQWQSPEAAARGLVEACKHGESGSTWLVAGGKPAKDISDVVAKSYALFEQIYD